MRGFQGIVTVSDRLFKPSDAQLGNRGNEHPGFSVLWPVQGSVRRAALDDLATIHDGDLIGKGRDHRYVMCNE